MDKGQEVWLSTAYFPPIEYFAAIARAGSVILEAREIFQKQTYRSRCKILTANGLINLNIPIKRGEEPIGHKTPILKTEIDYSENWVHLHLKALEAAYRKSPFYDYYIDDLKAILQSGEGSLLKMNTALLHKLSEFCGLRVNISLSESYIKDAPLGVVDLRGRISPKSKGPSLLTELGLEKPYYQVFTPTKGFVSNLSVVDLLFNEGPNSISYLI